MTLEGQDWRLQPRGRHPLKALVQEFDLPKSTAALYVRQAKERGDIPTTVAAR